MLYTYVITDGIISQAVLLTSISHMNNTLSKGLVNFNNFDLVKIFHSVVCLAFTEIFVLTSRLLNVIRESIMLLCYLLLLV